MEKKDLIIIIVSTATLIVTLIGTIINPILQDKPIVSVYLGNDQSLPLFLQSDLRFSPPPQYANIFLSNVGKTTANFDITAIGHNATISFDIKSWSVNQTIPLSVPPSPDQQYYKIYVNPDPNVNSFSIAILVTKPNPFYEELDTPNEQISVYHKRFDGNWEWSK